MNFSVVLTWIVFPLAFALVQWLGAPSVSAEEAASIDEQDEGEEHAREPVDTPEESPDTDREGAEQPPVTGAEGEEAAELPGEAASLDEMESDAPVGMLQLEDPSDAEMMLGGASLEPEGTLEGSPRPVFEAEPVVVTGTRTKRRRIDAPQAVSIVDQETLHRERPASIGQALDGVAGVRTVTRGVLFNNPSIRGLSGRRVVMLVDGLRIESSKTMGATGYWVDMDDVERLEVIRGPTSVMYGTDALGGVVNTITRDGFADIGFHGRYRLLLNTNNSELTNAAGLSFGSKRWFIRASGRWRDAENYTDGNGDIVEMSQYNDRMVSAEMGFRFGASKLIISAQNYFGRDIGKIASEEDLTRHRKIYFPEEDNHRLTIRYMYEGEGVLEQFGAAAVANWTFRHQRVDSYTVGWERQQQQVDSEGEYLYIDGQVYGTFGLGENNDLTVGASATGNFYDATKSGFGFLPDGTPLEATSEVIFDDIRSLSIGAFVQDEWDIIEPLSLTLGLRYDAVESWGALDVDDPSEHVHEQAFSGNFGLVYRPIQPLALVLNAGRAFRAASIREKYFFGSTCFGVYCGTPNLEPETSWNVELGARLRFGQFEFEAFFFNSFVDGLISGVPAPEDTECDFVYQNAENAWLIGVDGELRMRRIRLGHDAVNLRPFARFSYVRAEELESGDPIAQIPPARFQFGIRLFGGARGIRQYYLEVRATAELAQDRVVEGEPTTESYVLVDALAGLEFPGFLFFDGARLNVKLSNIGDVSYRNHLAVSPGRGRNLRIGFDIFF